VPHFCFGRFLVQFIIFSLYDCGICIFFIDIYGGKSLHCVSVGFSEPYKLYSNPNSVQEFSFTQRPQRILTQRPQSSTETNLFATFAKNSATFA